MTKFYTADQHFDHKNIINLCERPFYDIEDMQEALVKNWNTKVLAGDDVYILGDFCFGVEAFQSFIKRLNGIKHFITGNHDSDAIKKLKQLKQVGLKYGKKNPLYNCLFHGDIKEIKDNNQRLVLCHYPIYEWHGSFKGAIHLHGHSHQNIGRSFKPNAYDVGVDGWGFAPVTLEEVLSFEG